MNSFGPERDMIHFEMGGDKRIYQQLRVPVESISGDFVDLPTSGA